MNNKMIKIIAGLVALVGCAFGCYAYEKNNLTSKIKRARCLDIQFVKDWIGKQDLEKYNKSYTAVMLRGQEIPQSGKLKLFFDIEKLVALCIYDKESKSVVTKELFMADKISSEFGDDDFVEFPFEM